MTLDQMIVFGVVASALLFFLWGRIRYDLVALGALMVLVLAGLVPSEQAFAGFGHPAVTTVAAVLVLTRALQNSGLVELIGRHIDRFTRQATARLMTFTGLVAGSSGFMNNIGACALFMPVAIRTATLQKQSPSHLLMPISFASLLGGLVTLIGTPPNVIISSIRAEHLGSGYGMFDFTPVGLGVAVAGILYISLLGWRLLPRNREAPNPVATLRGEETYSAEIRVPAEARWAGAMVGEIVAAGRGDISVLALVRNKRRQLAPSSRERVRGDDILVLEGNADTIRRLVEEGALEFAGMAELAAEQLHSEEVSLTEAVVMPGSIMLGRTAQRLQLRRVYEVNLLAVARRGRSLGGRIGTTRFQVGDVLLLQGYKTLLPEALATLGCLPLAEQGAGPIKRGHLPLTLAVFFAALIVTALGLLPVQIAFVLAVLGMVAAQSITLRELYEAIDWPVIVLLAAMIPVGAALETTGGTGLIASSLALIADQVSLPVLLGVTIALSMVISDVLNNAATAVLMGPLAYELAGQLGVPPDALLMATAVGASCTFLTPIGHQSNLLVMGPGGYRFGDYWRMGLPLDGVIILVAVPLTLWVWT